MKATSHPDPEFEPHPSHKTFHYTSSRVGSARHKGPVSCECVTLHATPDDQCHHTSGECPLSGHRRIKEDHSPTTSPTPCSLDTSLILS
ncbi:hypothetical protein RRG08_067293 [Elysia crispata]|uniref:Uncharacterized protein n=1 Tax=Elysia crispata TaxID=231223 RepID=A0AAE1DCL3_9GAST|nr:hypothetical protein RRG08_067293 [Elysia crispata]